MKTITENLIQQKIALFFRNTYCLKHHSPRCCIFAVPNDSENAREQQRKVATGLLAGVSDLIVLIPNKTIFFEVKTLTGVQSKAQKEFQKQVEDLGYDYHLVRSLKEFQEIIQLKYCLYK